MCSFVPVDVTHIPTTTSVDIDEETRGLNVTIIGISVAIALLIVIGVVASLTVIVAITVVIKRKRGNQFEGKTANNATARNGVGKLIDTLWCIMIPMLGRNDYLALLFLDNRVYGAPDRSKIVDAREDNNYFELEEPSISNMYESQTYSEVTNPVMQVSDCIMAIH